MMICHTKCYVTKGIGSGRLYAPGEVWEGPGKVPPHHFSEDGLQPASYKKPAPKSSQVAEVNGVVITEETKSEAEQNIRELLKASGVRVAHNASFESLLKKLAMLGGTMGGANQLAPDETPDMEETPAKEVDKE